MIGLNNKVLGVKDSTRVTILQYTIVYITLEKDQNSKLAQMSN